MIGRGGWDWRGRAERDRISYEGIENVWGGKERARMEVPGRGKKRREVVGRERGGKALEPEQEGTFTRGWKYVRMSMQFKR